MFEYFLGHDTGLDPMMDGFAIRLIRKRDRESWDVLWTRPRPGRNDGLDT